MPTNDRTINHPLVLSHIRHSRLAGRDSDFALLFTSPGESTESVVVIRGFNEANTLSACTVAAEEIIADTGYTVVNVYVVGLEWPGLPEGLSADQLTDALVGSGATSVEFLGVNWAAAHEPITDLSGEERCKMGPVMFADVAGN